MLEHHSNWFEIKTSTDNEEYRLVTPSVRFRNCCFSSTCNTENKSDVLGYQNRDDNGNTFYIINEAGASVATVAYKLKMVFDNCRFEMNYDTKTSPFLKLYGNYNSKLNALSEYEFNNNKIIFYIENTICTAPSTLQNTMSRGFFVNVNNGAKIAIRNCDFYGNLDGFDDGCYLWLTKGYQNADQNVINENNTYYKTL